MKHSLILILVALGFLLAVLPGCSYDEDLTASQPALYPPTGLRAATIDSTSIRLTWNPSPSETDPRFEWYKLYWTYVNTSDTAVAKPDSVNLPAGTSSYLATGLTNGVEYVFTLSIIPGGEAVQVFPSLHWAPASGFGPFILPAQSVFALVDSTLTSPGPSVIAPADPNAQRFGDFILGPDLTLRSTGMNGSGWRTTLFSTTSVPSASDTIPLPSFPSVGSFTDSLVSIQAGTAYYCRTQDGHYARIYVSSISMPAGSLPEATLMISYQTRPNVPFAKRSQ